MFSHVDDLTSLVEDWPVDVVAAAVTDGAEIMGGAGDLDWETRIASISKLFVGLVALIALEEGSISLDQPAGPPGATVEHLLAHASGLGFDSERMLAAPGTRRIYSNTGIERFCDHLETRTEMSFTEYLRVGVIGPLGLESVALRGSPAADIHANAADLVRFAQEIMSPTLVTATTVSDATEAHFPSLPGVVPGLGSFDPNPWGLTFEIRGEKTPHWTGRDNSKRTFGHFGGSGTFIWIDPEVGLAAVVLTNREFGPWALEAWPGFSDRALALYSTGSPLSS